LGHEEETLAESCGTGAPLPLLERWIDKIGFYPARQDASGAAILV
jgi:hypothetical protein